MYWIYWMFDENNSSKFESKSPKITLRIDQNIQIWCHDGIIEFDFRLIMLHMGGGGGMVFW